MPRSPNRATSAAAVITSAATGPSTTPVITTPPASCAYRATSAISPATAAPGVAVYSVSPRRESLRSSRTSGCSSKAAGASVRVTRMSLRAHAPSTRRLISSVNAAWNGERTDCSSSEATASPAASRTPPQIPLPPPATRPMAALVPITKPRGSKPITRLSAIDARATRPATGSSAMIDHQLRQRFRRHLAQTAQRAAAAQKALGGLPGREREGSSCGGSNRRDWDIAPLIRQDGPAHKKHASGGRRDTGPAVCPALTPAGQAIRPRLRQPRYRR